MLFADIEIGTHYRIKENRGGLRIDDLVICQNKRRDPDQGNQVEVSKSGYSHWVSPRALETLCPAKDAHRRRTGPLVQGLCAVLDLIDVPQLRDVEIISTDLSVTLILDWKAADHLIYQGGLMTDWPMPGEYESIKVARNAAFLHSILFNNSPQVEVLIDLLSVDTEPVFHVVMHPRRVPGLIRWLHDHAPAPVQAGDPLSEWLTGP